MGNIILLNSAINAIKNLPSVTIDLMLPAAFEPLMRDIRVDNIISIEKRAYITRPWKLISLLRSLRKTGYDLAIDCSDVNSLSLTGAVYTLLSGSKRTAGWRMDANRVFDIEVPRYDNTIHAGEMYLRLISGVFNQRLDGEPYFPDTPAALVNTIPIVGINCGGRGPKKWDLENFLQIGNMLSVKGIKTEFILGPDEEESRSFLEKHLPKRGALIPLTQIADLKDLFCRYAAFVSSDTGPMHLAWSLRIPTVAIFIDSEIEKFKPLSSGSVALDARDGVDLQTVFDHVTRIIKTREVPA
ncbi:MAG: glycosyltransferase family 9 protein [candidate division Zixibacteria bacterium]